jgi:TP901 family phage tail tape measure protein
MAANNQKASGQVYLDTSSAQFALEKLNRQIDKYDAKLKSNTLTAREMAKVEEQRLGLVEKRGKVQEQIEKGIGATIDQQRKYVSALNKELIHVAHNTEEWTKKYDAFKTAKLRLNEMEDSIHSIGKAQKTWLQEAKGVAAGVFIANGVQQGLGIIQNQISEGFRQRKELEKSVAELSAITGATGKDLQFLKDNAIALSVNGYNSAKEYVEAMKLIASAKPELLEHKELLLEVTTASKLLSEASGLTLPEAATKLTDALNQFGAGASQAVLFTDALAASSKYGAAEVPQVTDALLEFGSQAKSSNINIYESSAAIEVLAEKGIKGAEAGTKLRNIFLALNAVDGLDKKAIDSLQAAGVNIERLKDNALPLHLRLQELSKISDNAASMVAVFGKENFNAGQIILQNIPRLQQLTNQVQEVGVASNQAKTNTDTWASSWENLKNVANAQFLEGENSFFIWFNKSLASSIQGMGTFIRSFTLMGSKVDNFKAIAEGAKQADENAVKGLLAAYGTRRVQVKDSKGVVQKDEQGNVLYTTKILTATEKLAALESALNFDRQNYSKAKAANDVKSFNAAVSSIETTKKAIALIKEEAQAEKSAAALKRIADTEMKSKEKSTTSGESSKKQTDPLLKELKDFQAELEKIGKQTDETEIGRITKKYNELIAKASHYTTQVIQLESAKNAAVKVLFDQHMAKLAKEEQEQHLQTITNGAYEIDFKIQLLQDFAADQTNHKELQKQALKEVAQLQKELNKQRLEDEKATNQKATEEHNKIVRQAAASHKAKLEYQKITASNPDEALKADIALLNHQKQLELQNAELTESEIKLIKEKYRQQENELIVKHYANQITNVLNGFQTALGILDQFAQAATAKENAQFEKEKRANSKKRKEIEDLAKAKVISQVEAQRRLRAIDIEEEKRKEELEKKQHARSKRIAIAQAVVNGALAITSILAQYPKFDGGFAMWASIALSIATTAAQIATISAQKFAKGGKVLPNGKITQAQNIPTQSNGDNILATVRTGEVILNERQQAALGGANTFAAIGVPGFAGGGYLKPFYKTRPYQALNYSAIAQRQLAIQQFAGGGLAGKNQVVSVNVPQQEDTEMKNIMRAVLHQLQNPVVPSLNINNEISLRKIHDAEKLQATIIADSKGI